MNLKENEFIACPGLDFSSDLMKQYIKSDNFITFNKSITYAPDSIEIKPCKNFRVTEFTSMLHYYNYIT